MATLYGDGKAGRFAKSQAQRQLQREWLWSYYLCALLSAVAGFGCAILLGAWNFFSRMPYGLWTFVLFAIFLAGLILAFDQFLRSWSRLLVRKTDQIWQERIRWLRGGQAEGLVAWVLDDLPSSWHLFNGIKPKNGGDIDHVLAGPGGVFALSTKSLKGTYTVKDGTAYFLNGLPTDHLKEAQAMALKVRNWLEVSLQNSDDCMRIPYVQAVLVTPFAFVDFPSQQSTAWVYNEDVLLQQLAGVSEKLKGKELAAVVGAIKSFSGLEEMDRSEKPLRSS